MSKPFDLLRERLLKAGVAPRHVARYIDELSAHLEDATAEELAKGRSPAQAEAVALGRLGAPESLEEAALRRPELRSLAGRWPLPVFGATPFLVIGGVMAGLLLAEGFLAKGLKLTHGPGYLPPDWLIEALGLLNWSAMYALPIALSFVLVRIALRQRLQLGWTLVAALAPAIVGSLPDLVLTANQISIGAGFGYPRSLPRLAVNVGCALAAWMALSRSERRRSA